MNYTNDENVALINDLCACEQKYLARIAEQDARIAELTAEVARYKAALEEIVDPESFGWDSSKLPDAVWLARNALKEW